MVDPVIPIPSGPVQISETRILVNRATGEIVGREGLNTDPDRCPHDTCGRIGTCGDHCTCAQCICDECQTRERISLLTPAPNRPVMKLFG